MSGGAGMRSWLCRAHTITICLGSNTCNTAHVELLLIFRITNESIN